MAQLTDDRLVATNRFRDERIGEPLDHYLDFYRSAHEAFAKILEISDNLLTAKQTNIARELLTDKERQHLCRYIASPPLSEDDLKTLADCSLAVSVLGSNADYVDRVIGFIFTGLDGERFPWVSEGRSPSDVEYRVALVSTAAMYAMRKTETWRRGHGRSLEQQVREYLTDLGLQQVAPKVIENGSQGPQLGQFCGETTVVGGKADIVVRLFDGRLMPIECKVSNSEVNSYKRLIHDCGEKAMAWIAALGPANLVPVAMLSGVYSVGNLRKAQDMGLTLIWSHDLTALGRFINQTR